MSTQPKLVQPKPSGAELFVSASQRYQTDNDGKRQALLDVASGYVEIRAAILETHNGKLPATTKMAAAIREELGDLQNDLGTICLSWIEDPSVRSALFWMHQKPEQVAWVFEKSEASTPKTVKQAWQNHFQGVAKDGFEGKDPAKDVAETLPGTTVKEVKDVYDELKAKAAEGKVYSVSKGKLLKSPTLLANIKKLIAEIEKEIVRRHIKWNIRAV